MTEVQRLARELLAHYGRPKRRAVPRVAAPLADAEHRMIDGVATWRLGQGPAVLLVHGWEDDNSLWAELIASLAWRGRAVVAIDLPAHGYSEGDEIRVLSGAASIARVAAAAGPITAVAGHSFGCVLTAFAMAEHGFTPDRAALIAAPVAQASQFPRMCARYGVPDEVAEAAVTLWEEVNGRPIDAFDLRALAPQFKAVGLIAHSMDDDGCPIEPALEVAALWPGCATVIADGLGHRAIAKDAEIVAQLAAFLDP